MIQGCLQLWTRAGPTEVGMQALRVTAAHRGDYSGLTEYAMRTRSRYTPVFEYIGKQSRLKAIEGNMPDVVLIAVRHQLTGDYLSYTDMALLAGMFGVPIVERFLELEQLSLDQIQANVRTWINCEGVVIRFTDNTWLKIKSKWWLSTGYSQAYTDKIANRIHEEKLRLNDKKARLQHHSLRLAVTNLRGDTTSFHIKAWFPEAQKVELAYTHAGHLKVAIASFSNKAQRDHALLDPTNSDLMLQQAYSVRTRSNARVRVSTFYF